MQKTFNQWLRQWGFKWVEDEQFFKGFMTEGEAKELARDYVSRGAITRG